MPERIVVRVVPFPDRPALQLQWTDPASGRRKTRSAGTADPAEAERKRADLEYELTHRLDAAGRPRVTWEQFREAFEREYLAGLRPATGTVYGALFGHVERILDPTDLDELTTRAVSLLVAGLRQTKGKGGTMQPSSIRVFLKNLHAALSWARRQGMIAAMPDVPEIKVPRRKPRPVAPEHYTRLFLAAADPYLRAFVGCGWLAGLRRTEAQQLQWEPSERVPWLDPERRRLWIPAAFAKAVEDQWVPLDPELEKLLCSLPRSHAPFVFPWHSVTPQEAGRRVIALARKAGVPLTMRSLRRGFVTRYAETQPAQVVQRLARHADIKTTMDYYANVDRAAEQAVFRRVTTDVTPPPTG